MVFFQLLKILTARVHLLEARLLDLALVCLYFDRVIPLLTSPMGHTSQII